jgi:hypothetical protein
MYSESSEYEYSLFSVFNLRCLGDCLLGLKLSLNAVQLVNFLVYI